MNFGRRLSRFANAGRHGPESSATPSAPEAPPPADATTSAEPGSPQGQHAQVKSGSAGGGSQVLLELRAKMNAILTRREGQTTMQPRPSLEAVVPRAEDAGMVEEQTKHGPLWRTQIRLPASERVGRVPLAGAEMALSGQLALLALDSSLADVDLGRALFFDTETTGLGGGAGTYAFLLGVGYFKDGHWWLEQLMLGGPEQEPALLERYRELLSEASCLVSFNGKSYDWPLLSGRYVLNRLPGVSPVPHLDLLHLTRRVHKRRLARCSLKHVESAVLGFERLGDIEGAEVAGRYSHFLRCGDAGGLLPVVEHNRWDVLSMIALVSLYGEAEPALLAEDYLGMAETLRRAKAWDSALSAASVAVDAGVGAEALQVRGEIHKAVGDRLQALKDFEAAGEDSADPKVRLELAKLYEHFQQRHDKALAVTRRGTGETEESTAKRIARLERKLSRR